MLVKEWMTAKVIFIHPETSMMQAQRMLAENKVRRLPVVDDVGRVVGIVSDRDIKEALPSKATSLDRHEINYLISELKVREIMTKNPAGGTRPPKIKPIKIAI